MSNERVEMILSNGTWQITSEIVDSKIDSCLKKFPLTYSYIILDVNYDGEKIIVNSGKWADDDDYLSDMAFEELEELLYKVQKEEKDIRDYIINNIKDVFV